MSGPVVAVFGGSFNPPHIAHVLAATYVLGACEVDDFLVVPTFIHPFAKSLAPFEHRLEMCRLAFADLRRVSVSEVERELGGESRTLRTLEHLATTHPDWRMRLVVGSDVLGDVPRWYGFDRIRELAPPIVLGRIGFEDPSTLPAVLPEVSSTAIRKALSEARTDEVRALMPRRVMQYALAQGLYAAGCT